MHSKPSGRPRSAESEAAILASAATLFAEKGYAAASLEAIASRAGVGKQTIYRRWPSKPYLAAAVYETLVPQDRIVADTGTLRSDIEQLTEALFRRYATGPSGQLLAGLISDGQGKPDAMETLRHAFFNDRSRATRDMFQRARDRGELPPETSIDLMTDLFVGAIWVRLLVGHAPLDPAFARSLAGHFGGLCAPMEETDD